MAEAACSWPVELQWPGPGQPAGRGSWVWALRHRPWSSAGLGGGLALWAVCPGRLASRFVLRLGMVTSTRPVPAIFPETHRRPEPAFSRGAWEGPPPGLRPHRPLTAADWAVARRWASATGLPGVSATLGPVGEWEASSLDCPGHPHRPRDAFSSHCPRETLGPQRGRWPGLGDTHGKGRVQQCPFCGRGTSASLWAVDFMDWGAGCQGKGQCPG